MITHTINSGDVLVRRRPGPFRIFDDQHMYTCNKTHVVFMYTRPVQPGELGTTCQYFENIVLCSGKLVALCEVAQTSAIAIKLIFNDWNVLPNVESKINSHGI